MHRLLLFASLLIFSGCSMSGYLNKEVKNSKILQQQHTGIAVYDLHGNKALASYQEDKYFIPASNTKLFSFYAGLCALGDSIPGIEYLEWGELLLFRGTGDPSLLHPDLPHSKVYDFLKGRKEQLFFVPTNFEEKRFGSGWAWDDYNEYYQPEISSLPVYGNMARFSADSSHTLRAQPRFWNNKLLPDTNVQSVEREEFNNVFHYSKIGVPAGLIEDIPVLTSDSLTLSLLSDTLEKEVKLIHIPLNVELSTCYSIPSDSLYSRMMLESDNMLANQLMLLYASKNGLPLNTAKAIEHVTEHHLGDLPDKPIWKDGSGLSRYNLFTPRSIAALLRKIYDKVPQDRLFSILPTGGKSGTLANLFKQNEPFIFAKTGTLSNNYCLSGYLITKKGKTFIFSFMNNNFTVPISEVRKEVERILVGIHNRY